MNGNVTKHIRNYNINLIYCRILYRKHIKYEGIIVANEKYKLYLLLFIKSSGQSLFNEQYAIIEPN